MRALRAHAPTRRDATRCAEKIFTRGTFVGAEDIDPLELRDDADAATGGYVLSLVERELGGAAHRRRAPKRDVDAVDDGDAVDAGRAATSSAASDDASAQRVAISVVVRVGGAPRRSLASDNDNIVAPSRRRCTRPRATSCTTNSTTIRCAAHSTRV